MGNCCLVKKKMYEQTQHSVSSSQSNEEQAENILSESSSPIEEIGCPICFEEVSEVDKKICRHCNKNFCISCWNRWEIRHHTCPWCRASTLTPSRIKFIKDLERIIRHNLDIPDDTELDIELYT